MRRLFFIPKLNDDTLARELAAARRTMRPAIVTFRPDEFEVASLKPIPGVRFETSDKVKPKFHIWIEGESNGKNSDNFSNPGRVAISGRSFCGNGPDNAGEAN